ncbi:MAG TPA: twin-arginine translocation signal domain-containing protein, partial [Smithellaceae bacterium]|nr:twin-arginine translocation signal domain-containing protein [Smithellaceae bacterium]
MIKKREIHDKITRRQFLQASAAAGLMLSSPGLAGGASLPSYTQIRTDDGKALILTNCNIVDVVSGELLRSKIIVVRRGFIESVSDRMP